MTALQTPPSIIDRIAAADAERVNDNRRFYYSLVKTVADGEAIEPETVLEELRGVGKSAEEFRVDLADLLRLRQLRDSAAEAPGLESKLRKELNPAVAAARENLKNGIKKLEDELRQAKGNQSHAVQKHFRCRVDGIEAGKVEQGLKASIGLPNEFAI